MHLGDLRVSDVQAAAAGFVNELPGFVARRVHEGRAACPALHRLRLLAVRLNRVHLGADLVAILERTLVNGF